MRSLILTSHFPFGRPSGGRLRSLFMTKALAQLGEVTLLCLHDDEAPPESYAEARRYCADIRHPRFEKVPAHADLPAWLRTPVVRKLGLDPRPLAVQDLYRRAIHAALLDARLEEYDLILVRYAGYAQYFFLDPKLARHRHRLVIDVDDNDLRAASLPHVRLPRRERARLARYYRYLRLPRACLVSSEIDEAYFRDRSLARQVLFAPNVIQAPKRRPPRPRADLPPTLLFCGTLNYPPNAEGISQFARNEFPKVRAVHPTARLLVVGRDPGAEVRALDSLPGVEVHPNVANQDEYYAQSTLAVVPLIHGTGTRVKILEAMAQGCPVATTEIGGEGLNLRTGQEALVVPHLSGLASACLAILGNPQLAESLSQAGFSLVRRRHVPGRLKNVLAELAKETRH